MYYVRTLWRPLALSLVLLALWFALSGYFEKPTLVALGFASVGVCVLLASRAGVLDSEGVPLNIFPRIIPYMFWLTFEIGKANFAVAREILRPTLRLSPKMIRVPTTQTNDVGKTIFGNSVTLTPGTVTVDVDHNELVIHALTDDLADIDGISAMGDKVTALDAPMGMVGSHAVQPPKEES